MRCSSFFACKFPAGRSRYDMLDGIDCQQPFAGMDNSPDDVVLPLLKELLGDDCHRLFNGLL